MKLESTVGLGTFPFSNVFAPVDAKTAEAIIHAFIDEGGKYIQTAPYYDGVDTLVGQILREIPRDKYYISTLCVKNREGDRVGNRQAIFEQCEDSLKHLGLEYIDIYMTSTTKATDASFSETIGAMEDLKEQGKIRHIGVTNVTLEQLMEYNASGSVTFVQNRFSYINRSMDKDFTDYCTSNSIQLVPYGVIEHGLLTSKNLKPFQLRKDDLRHVLPEFDDERKSLLHHWVLDHVYPIAQKFNTTVEALAIWWALQQPNITIPVVGATEVTQIEESLKALQLPTDAPELLQKMDSAYSKLSEDIEARYSQSVEQYLGNVYK